MSSLKRIFICRLSMVKSAYLYKMQKEGWIFESSFLKGDGCYFRKGTSDNLILAIKNKKYSEQEILQSDDDLRIFLSTLDSRIIYSDKKFIYYSLENNEKIKDLIKERMENDRLFFEIYRFISAFLILGDVFHVICGGDMHEIIGILLYFLFYLYFHRRLKLLKNFGKEIGVWHNDDDFWETDEPE